MKNQTILGLLIFTLLIALCTGCNQQAYPEKLPPVNNADIIDDSNVIKENVTLTRDDIFNESRPPVDIVEKRGQRTNITSFDELAKRASAIKSFKYNLTDSEYGVKNYQFFVLGRYVKERFPDIRQYDSGEKYDEILMDRLTKTAFSHCSKDSCKKPNLDLEVEKVNFDDYYITDPMEYLYKASGNKTYLGEEMLGQETTKVFSIKYEGNDAKIWLQEYYGVPLKIQVNMPDGKNRNILFNDMFVGATRVGEIELPFNFTVKGEGNKSWVMWEHYTGEWPKKGELVMGPDGKPIIAGKPIAAGL